MKLASPLGERRAGVLLHLSSLDAPEGADDGIGDLGPGAHRFLRWLAATGFGAWQMLPIGPVGAGDSPFSAESSFAGEPLFVSLDALVEEGWLPRAALARARDDARRGQRRDRRRDAELRRSARRPRRPGAAVDWSTVRRIKGSLFREAYERYLARGGARSAEYRRFIRERRWLPAWCAFVEGRGGSPGEAAFIQFAFERQWRALRDAARALDVQLIGDLPIFVAPSSADVLERPDLFRLDARGRLTVVTGVPPDDFSRDGQRWGHPHYRWPAHARDGFAWWRSRVRAGVERFDLLRIDHFIGFTRAWEIAAAARTARRGRWRPTPGRALLRAIARDFGGLPFIAEDLGLRTPEVIALRDEFELPGMRILQHAFGSDDAIDLPHRHPTNAVVYPGTHDNDTAAGWWRTLPPAARRRFLDYAGGTPRDAVSELIRMTCTSPARLGVVTMQDLLGLGSEARMNQPGRAHGQWRWRLSPRWWDDVDAAGWRRVIAACGRLPGGRTRRS